MGCVGISGSHARQLLRLLSGLMHLGNIVLSPKEDGCTVAEGTGAAALSRCCKLLRCAPQHLSTALTQRRIEAGGERISVPASAAAATQARDAVAKALYSRLFNHVVRCINRSLGGPGPAISSSPRARKAEAFAEEEEATAAAQEAVEAEVEAEAVAEAEGSAGPSHGSAGSDYW